MVDVSDNFKALSMRNGRYVSCKIVAGNETFLDDRIIEFDFDDVVHPNWYTIGSTCSNRFAFSVQYSGELEVHDEVKPYISFDGKEWCPLGVFYVARRYVRGKYASIICYDRMYSLDTEYEPKVSAPTTTAAILGDICANYGIVCESGVYGYAVNTVPTGATVRDVIGYIAGVENANAKFDREGKLRIKSYTQTDSFSLSVNNCMDYSRNMSSSKISGLKVDTGQEIIEAGSRGELTSLELYNPLMTKQRAENIVSLLSQINFYGADIEMQGFPFLESGDHIYLLDEDGNNYPIAVSEIEFHYNGGFTARLYSKSRSYTDAADYQDDRPADICLKSENSGNIGISSAAVKAASFEFEPRTTGAYARGDMSFVLEGTGSVEIKAYVNNVLVRDVTHKNQSDKQLVHFYFLSQNLPKGKNSVYITIQSLSGTMSIKSGGLLSTLICGATTV